MTTAAPPVSTPSADSAISARFDAAFRRLIRLEGGDVNHPADRGGATAYGISLRFLLAEGRIDANRDGVADFDLDMDGDIDGADIRQLKPEHARALYHRCFWQRLDGDSYPAPLGEALFDQAVNGGLGTACKLLQSAINRAATVSDLRSIPLAVDGVIGKRTRAQLDSLLKRPDGGMRSIISAYRAAAADRYRAIVARDASQVVFLRGWLRRASELGSLT